MEIQNLDKLPENARSVLAPYLKELVDTYGGDIVSIFAYGSVTGRDYNPKTSDINVAVVLNEVSLEKFKPMLKTVQKGIKRKITAPLFLSPSYIKMSLDTFPMEFMSMKGSSLVLYGDDVLSGITVDKADLRRECEYQLKGKLLTIRQAYLEQGLNHKALERLLKASFRALMPVLENVLRLKREDSIANNKEGILHQLGEDFGVNVSSFIEILRDKEADAKIGGRSIEAFLSDFLAQLEKLIEIVDNMQI
ncbi:MAG: hypothetical protein PVH45_04580 [Candidatus Omnitrophota bacterium]|jgi:hypothetical protein